MRIALISDIHGNLPALEAVLNDIADSAVDQIVCLGDICDLGPLPGETLEAIRALGGPVIQGNHDPFEEKGPQIIQAVSDWCAQQLSDEQRDYLKSLPPQTSISLPRNRELLCVHGSPRSYHEGLVVEQATDELEQILEGSTADIICGGHTHVQMLRRHGEQLIVNVGSVGSAFAAVYTGKQPQLLPWAEYAIVDAQEENFRVELRRIHYKVNRLLDAISASTMPNKEAWASQWQAD